MRNTTWRLFHKLARYMQLSMERAPAPTASLMHSTRYQGFGPPPAGRARDRMQGHRRQARLMPRSQLRATVRHELP